MVLLGGERYPINHVKNKAAFSFPFNSDDFTWLIWYISMNKMGLPRGDLASRILSKLFAMLVDKSKKVGFDQSVMLSSL